jgi:predicted NBD/HSP70 family sugar kinase
MHLAEPRMSPSDLRDAILRAISETCDRAGMTPEALSGMGIAVPGLVDARRNFIYWSSALFDRNVDFGTVMADQAPCPVFLDNDANLVAKAEHLFGKARNESDFVVVTVEHGVGMGIISGGKIYRGARGCGAEFGHTKVQLEGALCQCGQRGCLEAYVGDYALLREANIMDRDKPLSHITELVENAQNGDPLAQSIFDRAGRMFALGLANIVNLFDPKLIILSGGRLSFDYLSADRVAEQMRNSVIQVDAPMPEIRIHAWGDEMWAKGAAAFAIEEVSALKVKELSKDAA